MRDVEHDVVGAPMLDKGAQLIFQILGLLSGKPRDREVAAIALRRRPVTVFAVAELGLNVVGAASRPCRRGAAVRKKRPPQ